MIKRDGRYYQYDYKSDAYFDEDGKELNESDEWDDDDYEPDEDSEDAVKVSMNSIEGNPGTTTLTVQGPGGRTTTITAPGTATDLVTDDLDNDGKRGDAALVMSNTNNVTVIRTVGGVLQSPVTYPTGAGTTPLVAAAGDINGDHFTDLVTANAGDYTTGSVSLLLGQNNGTFAPAASLTAGKAPRDIGLGDFNGDNKLDMAVADGSASQVIIRLGTGGGAFGPDIPVTTAQPNVLALEVVDFNPDVDSYDDIVTNGTLLLGRGDGTFAAPVNIASGYKPDAVLVKDLNRDRKPDVVFATIYEGIGTVLLGRGDGSVAPPQHYVLRGTPYAITSSNVFTGGYSKLTFSGGTYTTVLSGDFDGNYHWVRAIPTGAGLSQIDRATGAAVADFTGDGVPDVAVANQNVVMLPGLGGGNLGGPITVPGLTGTRSRAVTGDWNGDSRPDLAFTGQAPNGSQELTVLAGLGGGNFGPSVSLPLSAGTSARSEIIAASLNADAFPDLLVANFAAGNVSVFTGNGTGGFVARPIVDITAATSSTYTEAPGGIAAGDFNGDQHTDFAVAFAGDFDVRNGVLKIVLGNGDGTFQTPVTLRSAIAAKGVASADFDGDGKPDLALAMESPRFEWDVVIYPGNGNGTFGTPKPLGLTENLISGVVAANGDRDGKVDLAVPASGNRVLVLRGLGDGTFARVFSAPTGGGLPFFPDLNQDGWPDMVCPTGQGYLAVYVNEMPTVIPNTPDLRLTFDAAGLVLKWPAAFGEFGMEESADPAVSFAPSTRAITTENGYFKTTVNPSAAESRFFRLKQTK
ncbi:MAG TPA: VCBS repeat-containing protein [Verrucomicrobiales bacterium]|nr:VCBS repeat-containing protein [Verrucomicrobiales bacterium]